MKEYLSKKTIGFYLTVVATVLVVLGLVNYRAVSGTLQSVFILAGTVVAVEVLMLVLLRVIGYKPFLNFASSICAVLMAAAVIISVATQVDGFGYLVSGLYSFDDMKSYIWFAGLGIAAMVIYIIASFMEMERFKPEVVAEH